MINLNFNTFHFLLVWVKPGHQEAPKELADEEPESDFSDLDSFLEQASTSEQRMTKRKMRHLQKQMAGDSSSTVKELYQGSSLSYCCSIVVECYC